MKTIRAMKQTTTILIISLSLALAALWGTATAAAQSGNGYTLTWWTVDGGGESASSGGDYSLAGTIGLIRYRTRVRDPKDTTILLFSMVMGMACGLGQFKVAIVLQSKSE